MSEMGEYTRSPWSGPLNSFPRLGGYGLMLGQSYPFRDRNFPIPVTLVPMTCGKRYHSSPLTSSVGCGTY
jgi:hypothetical protein